MLVAAYPNVKYDQTITRIKNLTYEQCLIKKDNMFRKATENNNNIIIRCEIQV
jgi:hypothetical protein